MRQHLHHSPCRFWTTIVVLSAGLLFAACTQSWGEGEGNNPPGPQNDDDDDDDDTPVGDVCDDSPNEVICQGDQAITCDVNGDPAGTEDCDTAAGFYCFPGMGCIDCYPGQRWCEGPDVVECAADGLSYNVVETCNELAGLACDGGLCVSLCDQAEQQRSSIGCTFFGVDMEQDAGHVSLPYAIVVSNVNETVAARVKVESKSAGVWTEVGFEEIAPQSLATFSLNNNQISGTGLVQGNAYKVTSHIPVIAYQFNPLDGVSSYSSDASLLLPVSAYDVAYYLPAWGSQYGNSDLVVVAEVDGTQVTVTPTTATAAGSGVNAGQAGIPMAPIAMNEGDVLQIVGAASSSTMEGSLIESSERVAVFGGHSCANIPSANTWCDHVEEQVFGLQTWGVEYLAARLPARANPPEISLWHFMAGDETTTLTFEAHPEVGGLPGTTTLNPGQVWEAQVTGTTANPGDFLVTGTEAFLVTQYMIGELWGGDIGDPCMVQAVPVEQYLDNYVVLVPPTWVIDKMTLTRTPGDQIFVNGVDVDSWPQWSERVMVGIDWEVVRIEIPTDGAYVLEGTGPFGVQVVGYDDYDSYCYPGGLDQQIINDL